MEGGRHGIAIASDAVWSSATKVCITPASAPRFNNLYIHTSVTLRAIDGAITHDEGDPVTANNYEGQ